MYANTLKKVSICDILLKNSPLHKIFTRCTMICPKLTLKSNSHAMQACVSGEQFDGIKMGWIFFGSKRWMRYCPHQCRCPRAFLTLGLRGCRVAGAFVYGRTAFRSCVNHLNFSITSAQRSRFISQVPFAFAFASRSRSH
jgi:hypothetical protein